MQLYSKESNFLLVVTSQSNEERAAQLKRAKKEREEKLGAEFQANRNALQQEQNASQQAQVSLNLQTRLEEGEVAALGVAESRASRREREREQGREERARAAEARLRMGSSRDS